jgi:rubrerythrin
MNLRTASETLSFIRELEEKAALFYEDLAKRFPDKKEDFLAFSKENRKFNKQIQMAYQSVITDAIEGCYAFDLETDDYTFDTDLPAGATLSEAVGKSLVIEEKILRCYGMGAEQSGSLLADVPRNFKMVIKKRNSRIEKLQSM